MLAGSNNGFSGSIKSRQPIAAALAKNDRLMKTCASLSMILVILFSAPAGALTNVVCSATNTLAIYLVADDVARNSITYGTATPAGLRLNPQPILSDADFVAWDVTNHTFVITPTAAKRVAGGCTGGPFVLMASGEPIYLGLFGTSVSSSSVAVPVILTDSIVMDCFMGIDNVPHDVWRMIGRADPGVTDRLLAMTNATTNVTLRIDRGYPAPDGFGRGVDRRDDRRIAVAVDKLLGNKKH